MHEDPAGFSVDTPTGWNVTRDAGPGRITLRGQRGELAVIWPMFVEENQVGRREAGALVQQLARKVDDQLHWGRAEFSQSVARTIAKDGQRSGAALMTWSSEPNGTSVFFYFVEAPADVYRSSTESFAGILQSLRVLQDQALKTLQRAKLPRAHPLRFVSWTDPNENAFTMAVPQGWQILGGATG